MTLYEVPAIAPGRRSLRIFLVAVILLLLCLFAVSLWDPEGLTDSVRHLLGYAAMGVVILSIFVGLTLARQIGIWKSVQGFQVELTDEKIVAKRPQSSGVEMSLAEIRHIRESSDWLFVRGGELSRSMAIPRMLQDYDGLRRELASHHEIVRWRAYVYALSLVPALLGWVSVLVLVFSRDRATTRVSAAVVLLVSAWGFCSVWRLFRTKPIPRLLILMYVVNGFMLLWILFDKLRFIM